MAADHVSADTRRAQLRSEVNLAARVIPVHYPLETFIAVNPLAGLESMPFEQAIRRASH
ncbi:putative inorganic carbon transporter subunit DabA, partial [Mycobacterium sp.]|uniref:putative inorganic carbon transporter subunit DabA n=1 Tax=Mycobacterium sp. TaxID=1785 RepID=UPI0025EDDFA9